MSDIGDAIGTAAEGTLQSSAIEGESRRPLLNGHFAEEVCLNCGTPLVGAHCHACGQKAHLHRTLGAFMHDLLHGALHFEGKTWRTLPKLAFRPGALTRRYIEGERRNFVSPMALFLFSIFLMFAVFQIAGISTPSDLETRDAVSEDVAAAISEARSERDRLQSRIDELKSGNAERERLSARLAEVEGELQIMEGASTLVLDPERGTGITFANTGFAFLDKGLTKWRENPGLMLYKLQTNFYKFSWLLIPLSIPFVWLLFAWRRRFKAYDHAIFVTYSLSFMTILILAVTLLGTAGLHTALIAFALVVIPPVHIYKQLRGTYGISRFSAAWRLCVLTIFILMVLVIFVQLLLLLGAF